MTATLATLRGAGLRGWRGVLMAAVGGATLALVQAPWALWPAYFIAIPVWIWLLAGATTRRGRFAIGWAFGAGYFLVALSWLVEPFLIDSQRFGWLAPLALAAMAGGLALFWGTASAVGGGLLRMAAAFGLAELARSYLFTGFPWALIGQGWVDTPVIQLTSLVGTHGLGALTFIVAGAVARVDRRGMTLALTGLAGLWAGGWALAQMPLPERAEPFSVRVVQPNAAQDVKWLPEFERLFYDRLLASSAALGAPDLVVWPETAVGFLPDREPELLIEMAASVGGARLVFGARHFEEPDNWYNSLFVLSPAGRLEARYDKHHLVPFGEYLPFNDFAKAIGWRALADATALGFDSGIGPRVLRVAGLPAFLPLICYEAVFSQGTEVAGDRPELLLQITNDAWFGRFSGPYQHLAQARIRAIEQGLPLVRAANTGVSAVIDPRGQVVGQIPLQTAGHLDELLPAPLPPTLFSRTGDWLALAMLAALAVLSLRRRDTGV